MLAGTVGSAAAQAGSSARPAGSPEAFVHESWTVADGLPVNSINALLQGRDGYLWIATFDGLVRFDGVRFAVFNSSDSPGLTSNRITELHEGRDGTLWLRTEQMQLVRFRDGAFAHFGPERGLRGRVLAVSEDSAGTLWIGTSHGLGRIEGERFLPVAGATLQEPVSAVLRRADGTTWAGLQAGGLVRIEGEKATRVVPGGRFASREVTTLYEERDGTLWIGTAEGAWRYGHALERVLRAGMVVSFRPSPRTGELWILTTRHVYRVLGGNPIAVRERPDHLRQNDVLLADETGRMLYSSGPELEREGSRLYSLRTDAVAADTDPGAITALTFDHEGSLWLGTLAAGLHRLKPAPFTGYSEAEGLSNRNAYTVYEDRSGAIWVGTLAGGVNRIAGGRVTRFTQAHGYPLTPRSILQDRAGRFWLGDRGSAGLCVAQRPGAPCAPLADTPEFDGPILALHEDVRGALWVGADVLLRRDGAEWHRFSAAEGAPSFPVRAFQETTDGALWMGTNGGGLARYHEGRFRQVSVADGLPLDLVRSLYQDADGWLWVRTEGRGLARLDPREWQEGRRGGRIVSYGRAGGLFDEVIHQILEDDSGRLWMSSNRGIFWVQRQELLAFAEGSISRINSTGYTERDGLRNREANGGSQPAGVKSRDGRLWFPTQDGVAVVEPARIQRNPAPPNVVIERVMVMGTVLPVRPGAALALGVDQRNLEIEYTALSFLAPANVRFRYRLEGYDRAWVDAGNRRTAFYTHVPPGRYTFRVIASNNDGVWNEQGAALELRLAPHFHETHAFRLLVLLLLGLAVAGGFGWRVRNLRARTRELARVVEERTAQLRERERQLEAQNHQLVAQNVQLETQAGQLQALDRAKSHFFANVSHEFRTPLTLILGPLREITDGRRGRLPAWLQEQHEMMARSAQRLLRLVNQVLDLARLESHSLTLDIEPHDLTELARTVSHTFTPLAERRGVALRFNPPEEPLPVLVDAEQVEKVLFNLLSNAFKFTDGGGAVTVTLRAEEGQAVVAVMDTGIGILPEQLPHVFERFYQADSGVMRRYEGTGIGLSLVKELVELHGGTVRAESTPGVGSTFVVRLPMDVQRRGQRDERSAERRERAAGSEARGRGRGQAAGDAFPPHPEAGKPQSEVGSGDGELDRTTVLVVDDNADVRAYVRTVLESNFQVLEAVDGQEGLERAREVLPDLVISDVMMPRLDGFGLARALREEPATDCIPVILLTARAGDQTEIEGLAMGADDYLQKPFHAGVLLARVGGLIASRRRLRERLRQEGLPVVAAAPAPVPVRSALEERLRGIIEQNLTDPDFNPEALAAAAGMSYQQLYRQLAAELGAAPSHFLRTVRVEHAARLLREGAGSVTEVAYSVGFNSLSYFHRCFRERFGSTPMAFIALPAGPLSRPPNHHPRTTSDQNS